MMRKLKILMVFLSYRGDGLSKTGGDTYFIEISRRLLNKGHNISILTTPNGVKLLKNEGLKAEMHIVDIPLINKFLFIFDFLWRTFICLFKIRPPDFSDFDLIVSISPLFPDIIITAYLSLMIKVKPAIYHHGFVSPLMLSKYNLPLRLLAVSIQRKFLTWILKKTSFEIFALPVAKKELLNLGIPKHMIFDMVNGVDTKFIDQISVRDQLFDGIFLGSLIPRKGIFDLPDIWKDVTKVFPKARIAIVGTGTSKCINKMKFEVMKRNIEENFVFSGFVSKAEKKYTLLKSSKVFVFPSYSEVLPISVMEAMYCGLPCVVYSLEAYNIFKNGLIRVTPGDKKEFAKTIIKLLSNDELRLKIGNRAKQIMSHFDWNGIAMAHENALMKILK